MRKITSLTALVSFLLLLLNSIVLYIVPHGRIAYWADWRLWGLTKTEWTNQHVIIGILFLLAIFIHTFYNWTLIVAYLKNRARKLRIFTHEFNIELLLADICQEYGLNLSAILGKLTKANIEATPDANIKQIAEKNNLTTAEIFTALRKAAEKDL